MALLEQDQPPAEPPAIFREILLLVGQLNYTWTNTESLLIYLIGGLARTDKESAIVIFLTLNTTKARLELVERLAKMPATSPALRRAILAVTGQMAKQARLRNKYSHCIYSFDETGTQASTQLMRVVDDKDRIRYGKIEVIDGPELARIADAITAIKAINRDIWTIVETNRFPH